MTVTSQIPAICRRPRLKYDAMSGGNMGTSMAVLYGRAYFTGLLPGIIAGMRKKPP